MLEVKTSASPEKRFLVVAKVDISDIDWRRVAVFDIDGVLVDVTERMRASLEEVGAGDVCDPDLLRGEQRKRFWDVFLSSKYIHLDRPRRAGIELLNRAREEGKVIVLLSSRRGGMVKDTIKQMTDIGVEWDVLVHRAEGYTREFARDYEFKRDFVKEYLGGFVSELHDDFDRIINVFAAGVSFTKQGDTVFHQGIGAVYVVKHERDFWYNPPSFTFVVSDRAGRTVVRNIHDLTGSLAPGQLKYPVSIKWMWMNIAVDTEDELNDLLNRVVPVYAKYLDTIRHSKNSVAPQDIVAVRDEELGRTWYIPRQLASLVESAIKR